MISPLAFTSLEPRLDEMVQRTFPGRRQLRCEGFVVTEGFREIAEDILNLEVRIDDVWVCTYPKSGTTWTEEMVWCIANDPDLKDVNVPQMLRFPHLEVAHFFFRKKDSFKDKDDFELPMRLFTHSVDTVKDMKSPRFIKTHLPFNFLPLQIQHGIVKPKIIHVHRNPMDTCISYFHHNQLMMGYKGKLEDFVTLFVNDAVLFGPFWKHYLGYVERKKDQNILFLNYEDMKRDLPLAVRRTATFLNKPISEEQVELLSDHLNFGNMKNNPNSNNEDMVSMIKRINRVESEGRFLRQGTVGQWRSKFSQEWVLRFNKWTEASVQGAELERHIVV